MAMQFSKEDQEKLKNSSAEIYRKRTEETNREDVKNLSTQGKWQHFVDYYLRYVIIAVVIVAVVVTGIIEAATKKPTTSLYIAIQNDVFDEDTLAAFEDTIGEYLELDADNEVVVVNQTCTDQQLQTYFYAGTADILITDEDSFAQWGQAQYFYDSDENKEVAFYKDYEEKYRYYSQYVTGEDVLENETTQSTETEASDEKQYNCGIYLTDSEKYRQIGGMVEKPVLGISCTTKHLSEAKKFTKYMMDNSKKMTLHTKSKKSS